MNAKNEMEEYESFSEENKLEYNSQKYSSGDEDEGPSHYGLPEN